MRTTLIASSLFVLAQLTACESPADETGLSSQTSAASLPGSRFEIDDNANLVVNTSGNLDWVSVTEERRADTPSGALDNSFKGGSKEDDACPPVENGSIPNNKSDLKNFGVYVEPGTSPGDPGYMHMFWHRVQDPSGTTLMDFEFNQSKTDCGNGVNPVRTAGDLLLEYRLEQGGATATLKLREWSGTAWGAATDLTATGDATGTINSSAILAANADGLGAISVRTFGEASVALDSIFRSDKCTSFGSAFVKSRSSDSFTSALKDFISPVPIDISNCGRVVIRKETDPDGQAGSFGFTHNLQTDPASTTTFSLADGGSKEFTNVLLGTGYTVAENTPPTGFDLEGIDCSASTGVSPTIDTAARRVTFDIDATTDVVDCTYTNRAKGSLIVEKVTSDGDGTFGFDAGDLGTFNLTTTAAGVGGKDSKTFSNLAPASYAVAETEPTGWDLVSATCDDGSLPSSIGVGAGETVKCTFVNARERGAIKIHKYRRHAAAGLGWWPHAGVTFTVSGGGLGTPITVTTDAYGDACVDDLLISYFGGAYAVTESVPTGYVVVDSATQNVTVTKGTCATTKAVDFYNLPLTNITISVNSQIDGGTASTITCTGVDPLDTPASGDASLSLENLLSGSYTCTVVIK